MRPAGGRPSREFGRIDTLVNNAGICGRVLLTEMDDKTWAAMIGGNLTGVRRTIRAVLPSMKEQLSGSLINLSSVVGRSGKPNLTHCSASKFGVVGFTQALAREVAPYGIRVNLPDIVRTPMWDVELAEIVEATGVITEQAWEDAVATVPLHRPQTPEDIGYAAAFMSSATGGQHHRPGAQRRRRLRNALRKGFSHPHEGEAACPG